MNRKFVILGMHRSGTSWLAGSLEKAGICLGKVSNYNRFNKKGNKENDDIMKLHEKILSNNNLSWHSCKNKVQYNDDDLGIIADFFNENKNEKMIGFKDPRTLIFYDSFKKNFKDVLPIGIFRDPIKCANSIVSRDKFSLNYALEIWYFYNTLLLEYTKKSKIHLINFDENELKFFLLEKFLIDNSISDTQKSFEFEEESLINQKDVDTMIDSDKYYNLYYDLIDLSIQNYIK